ncbi:hypothetical protein HK104_009416 [Borealophlyctis nickersoniae]|nr:hypothetical protein HK104_009416 [Borealophlyctis nickersoniae]
MSSFERPRWTLRVEALCWRFLTDIGFYVHKFHPPRPLSPAFSRRIPSTLSPIKGQFDLIFYTPHTYEALAKPFPVVINFHGGGFTIGRATDDSRWATSLVQSLNCVVVSVDYRCGPEAPFPTAVEDGADAILWLLQHAKDLNLDPSNMAVSGFSAGGNLAFTVLLRLQDELNRRQQATLDNTTYSNNNNNNNNDQTREHAHYTPLAAPSAATVASAPRLSPVIKSVIAWYPSTDFTHTRIERRNTNIRPEKELPRFFTKLFDASYLYPPKTIDLHDPYLSPAVANAAVLKQALPDHILLYTCEWDELRDEAERFKDRLISLGKGVKYTMVQGVGHAWDKNPFGANALRDRYYAEACEELGKKFKEQRLSSHL